MRNESVCPHSRFFLKLSESDPLAVVVLFRSRSVNRLDMNDKHHAQKSRPKTAMFLFQLRYRYLFVVISCTDIFGVHKKQSEHHQVDYDINPTFIMCSEKNIVTKALSYFG